MVSPRLAVELEADAAADGLAPQSSAVHLA